MGLIWVKVVVLIPSHANSTNIIWYTSIIYHACLWSFVCKFLLSFRHIYWISHWALQLCFHTERDCMTVLMYSASFSGATQFVMWQCRVTAAPSPVTPCCWTPEGQYVVSRACVGPRLYKCPVNFLHNNGKATKSNHRHLPKHVTCDNPAYHKQRIPFWKLCIWWQVFLLSAYHRVF